MLKIITSADTIVSRQPSFLERTFGFSIFGARRHQAEVAVSALQAAVANTPAAQPTETVVEATTSAATVVADAQPKTVSAHDLFLEHYNSMAGIDKLVVQYDPKWANGTGYFNGMADLPLSFFKERAMTCVDVHGRRMIIMKSDIRGHIVLFERYAPNSVTHNTVCAQTFGCKIRAHDEGDVKVREVEYSGFGEHAHVVTIKHMEAIMDDFARSLIREESPLSAINEENSLDVFMDLATRGMYASSRGDFNLATNAVRAHLVDLKGMLVYQVMIGIGGGVELVFTRTPIAGGWFSLSKVDPSDSQRFGETLYNEPTFTEEMLKAAIAEVVKGVCTTHPDKVDRKGFLSWVGVDVEETITNTQAARKQVQRRPSRESKKATA